MKFFASGRAVEPESVKTCVLYHYSNGRIIHTHQVVTLPGGKIVEDSEVESRAFAMAKKAGHDVSKIKALHVSRKDYVEDRSYKVDLRSLRLTEIPGPPSTRTSLRLKRHRMRPRRIKG